MQHISLNFHINADAYVHQNPPDPQLNSPPYKTYGIW